MSRYLFLLLIALTHAATFEEQRLPRARQAMPEIASRFEAATQAFAQDWQAATDARATLQLAKQAGANLWAQARQDMRDRQDLDDRPLYWARLAIASAIRDNKPGFPLFAADRQAALAAFETASRGQDDITFPADRQTLRVLLTGFDPFLLDQCIERSNPSGVAALMLDGQEFTLKLAGGKARQVHIETMLFPVRKADFDDGQVEQALSPWYGAKPAASGDWLEAARARMGVVDDAHRAPPEVDLVMTTSMGRDGFALERFAGRRRSALAPDNEDIRTGGSLTEPVLPLLHNRPLVGEEFLESSLPIKAMLAVSGPYPTIDNHWVRVAATGSFYASSLAVLKGRTAYEGSGGGYYSNEISYRALALRDRLGVTALPVGHLHTPALERYDRERLQAIVRQMRALIEAAAAAVAGP
jgi:pyrrolidone-carboxylate peptidase